MGELSDLQYKVDDDTLRVSWNLPSHNDDLQVRETRLYNKYFFFIIHSLISNRNSVYKPVY